jgi:hypothetical protein
MSGLHAVAEFDYQAQEPTELSVQAGQPLIVVDKSDPQYIHLSSPTAPIILARCLFWKKKQCKRDPLIHIRSLLL